MHKNLPDEGLFLGTPNSNLMNLGGAQNCGRLMSITRDLMQVVETSLGSTGLEACLQLVGPCPPPPGVFSGGVGGVM